VLRACRTPAQKRLEDAKSVQPFGEKYNVISARECEAGSKQGGCFGWSQEQHAFIKRTMCYCPARERIQWIVLKNHQLPAVCEMRRRLGYHGAPLARTYVMEHIRKNNDAVLPPDLGES
jgi:hypothetical protein